MSKKYLYEDYQPGEPQYRLHESPPGGMLSPTDTKMWLDWVNKNFAEWSRIQNSISIPGPIKSSRTPMASG